MRISMNFSLPLAAVLFAAVVVPISGWAQSAASTVAVVPGSGGDENNQWNGNVTIGWQFALSSPVTVTGLGFFDATGGGLSDSHPVGIWNNGGTLLGSTTVPAGTEGTTLLSGFRFVFVEPFTLEAGTYTIGAYGNQTSPDKFRFGVSGSTTITGLTLGSGVQSTFGPTTLTFPTQVNAFAAQGYFGPDFTTETTSMSLTLQPGVQAVYSFDNNANKYKITSSPYSSGGEVLTITEVPILKSNFVPPANFPNETCVPVANFTTLNGADTCVEYQADCSFGGVPGGGDCNTLLYTLLDSFDLPSDLPAIGGPDFLVVHGSGCPTSSTAVAVSIFTDYFVTRIDPTIKGTGNGTGSCFIAMYTPGAPVITSGSTSRFVGWQSPVVDSDLNQVKAGSTRPLIFNWNDSSGNPITNLSYCNSFTMTNSGNVCQDSPTVPTPWVNLAQFVVACPGAATVNTASDTSTSTSGNSGFQNNGGGNYQANWQTQKIWKGTCRNVQVTFDNGVTEIPATLGFQFN